MRSLVSFFFFLNTVGDTRVVGQRRWRLHDCLFRLWGCAQHARRRRRRPPCGKRADAVAGPSGSLLSRRARCSESHRRVQLVEPIARALIGPRIGAVDRRPPNTPAGVRGGKKACFVASWSWRGWRGSEGGKMSTDSAVSFCGVPAIFVRPGAILGRADGHVYLCRCVTLWYWAVLGDRSGRTSDRSISRSRVRPDSP